MARTSTRSTRSTRAARIISMREGQLALRDALRDALCVALRDAYSDDARVAEDARDRLEVFGWYYDRELRDMARA